MMKHAFAVAVLGGVMVASAAAQAPQAPAADPLTSALKRQWDGIARNLVESAEVVPEAKYSFKPSPDVKTFGQEVGHAATGNYLFCSRAKGEPNPNKADLEAATKTKAEFIKSLLASNEYCASIFNGATDKTMLEMVGQGAGAQPRAAIVAANIAHANETYGTMVPYMRMSGIVPPSTARQQQR
jgi:hypothetical protein